jgi:hypothetical protein
MLLTADLPARRMLARSLAEFDLDSKKSNELCFSDHSKPIRCWEVNRCYCQPLGVRPEGTRT